MFIRYSKNEYGTKISVHECDTCGGEFTVCPEKHPEDEGWENCMAPECSSYDPTRDADRLFGDDSGFEKHKNLFPGKELDDRMPPAPIRKEAK